MNYPNFAENKDHKDIEGNEWKWRIRDSLYCKSCLAKQFSFEHLASSSSRCQDPTPNEDICHGA